MGVVTELEEALWNLASAIRRSEFGATLRDARSSRPEHLPVGPSREIHDLELSFDPAIQRTVAAYAARSMIHGAPPLDRSWLEWNQAALRAMARIAAKCWAGIDGEVRRDLVDMDDLHPVWNSTWLAGLRNDTLGRHLAFAGLDSPEIAAGLGRVYAAVRATPTYAAASEAALRLRTTPSLLQRWRRHALDARGLLEETLRTTPIGVGSDRSERLVRTLYSGSPVEESATALRLMNRLTQYVAWCILGLAEAVPEPLVLRNPIGVMQVARDSRTGPLLKMTVEEESGALLRLTSPVLVHTKTPVDGLYLVAAVTLHLLPVSSQDLTLVPIRSAASEWP